MYYVSIRLHDVSRMCVLDVHYVSINKYIMWVFGVHYGGFTYALCVS